MKKKLLGARIAKFRIKRGISTSSLANSINKSQATISRIENGKQNITLQTLLKIARQLRIHPLLLLTGENSIASTNSYKYGCFKEVMLAARKNKSISITEIADNLLKPVDYIKKIEAGEILPEEEELSIFARFYNLNLLLLQEMFYFERYATNLSQNVAKLVADFSAHLNSKLNKNNQLTDHQLDILDIFNLIDKNP